MSPPIQINIISQINDRYIVEKIFRVRTGLIPTDVQQVEDGWAIFLATDSEVDLVMCPGVRAALAEEDMKVVKLNQYQTKSTIVASRIPAPFLTRTTQELADIIGAKNNVHVEKVTFIRRGVIEIELDTPEDASLLLRTPGGIVLGPTSTLTYMQRKKNSKVTQCNKCFSFNHDSPDCPSPTHYCYHCAAEDHVGNECATNYLLCVNCKGDHVAFALKCPIRKLKEEEIRVREESLLAGASNGAGTHHDNCTGVVPPENLSAGGGYYEGAASTLSGQHRRRRSDSASGGHYGGVSASGGHYMGVGAIGSHHGGAGTTSRHYKGASDAHYGRGGASGGHYGSGGATGGQYGSGGATGGQYGNGGATGDHDGSGGDNDSDQEHDRERLAEEEVSFIMGRLDILLQLNRESLEALDTRADSRAENPLSLTYEGQISGLQASNFTKSPSRSTRRTINDPMPVTLQRTSDPNRPPSRLENPVPTPLIRPQAVNPRRRRMSECVPPGTAEKDPLEGRSRRRSGTLAVDQTVEKRNEGQSGSSSLPSSTSSRTLCLPRMRTDNPPPAPPDSEPTILPSSTVQPQLKCDKDFVTWRGNTSRGSESKSDSLSESLSNEED
ncbi:hypothetical protein Pmani_004631 [Petrolisthes manimaculis]|uniref:CCHC-type domain-containing protein n=1 Tax=Petrolisthes manimaculis TaxID=1843537 RepID=A0AAE1ULE0_9EUCA|nr:hypothetical protein Pmani_004631 [Petrolisthes manimaculis]